MIHDNTLYAANGSPIGEVYQRNSDNNWITLGGTIETGSPARSLATYNGSLYAGTGAFGDQAKVWRWTGVSWVLVKNLASDFGLNHDGVISLVSLNGNLYAGPAGQTYESLSIFVYDGTTWVTSPTIASCDYAILNIIDDQLWASGCNGQVYRLDGSLWTAMGTIGTEKVNGVTQYGSSVYAVTLNTGRIYSTVVDNVPPTVDAGGLYSGDEGSPIALNNASASDPDGDTLTFSWSVNSPLCTFSDFSVLQPTITCADNGIFMTTLTVSDGVNDPVSSEATVTVENVEPTATFVNISDTVIEGESATLEFSNQFDPSSVDTATGFQYSYDCDGDGTYDQTDITAASFACDYPNSGTFTAQGRIKDKDGGFLPDPYTAEVVVQTPQEATGTTIVAVEDLVDTGSLNEGQGNALISKLENIIEKINNGDTNAAINQLQAFINQVNDFINEGVLSPEEGQPLIDAANDIIAALSN